MEHGRHPEFSCGHSHNNSKIPFFHHGKLYCSKECYMDIIRKKGIELLHGLREPS
jgi:hypothetical protein